MKQEIWKPVVGYEGLYEVSNLGRVKSLCDRQGNIRILKPGNRGVGYLFVILYKQLKGKKHSVHRLVANGFIQKIDNKNIINHKNGIKTDNRVENLEWCTLSENCRHSFDTGLSKITKNHNFYTKHPSKGKFGKDNIASKPLSQYIKDMVFIKSWDSTIDIQRELRIPNGNISNCCNGKRKTAGGFIWRYL